MYTCPNQQATAELPSHNSLQLIIEYYKEKKNGSLRERKGKNHNKKIPPTFSSFLEACDFSGFFKPNNALIHFLEPPMTIDQLQTYHRKPTNALFDILLQKKNVLPDNGLPR